LDPVAFPLVATRNYDSVIKQLQATMVTVGKVLDLDAMRAEIATLAEEVADPNLWDDQANAQRVTGRLSVVQGEVDRFGALSTRLEDVELMVEMATEEADESALADADYELDRIAKAVETLEVRTLLSGEYDSREAIVSLRSGAGGVDAADFTEMLMRMYIRWAERNNYPVEIFDTSYAEEAGLKSATFAVHAPYAYGTLSVEAGTHRLVRISPFDNQGRRQTSFAAVEVVPVLEQTDVIEIPDRHGGLVSEREVPAAEQGVRDGRPQGQTAGPEEGRGEGAPGRAQGRRPGELGRPNAQLCTEPVPDG
jgi:peptide chain release factor 2